MSADGSAEVDGPTPTWDDELKAECRSLLSSITNAKVAKERIGRLRQMAELFPLEVEPNLAYAQARELTRVRFGMLDLWTELHQRFPGNSLAAKYRVRWMVRNHQLGDARALVQARHPETEDSPEQIAARAELFIELREFEEAKQVFEALLLKYPGEVRARITYAKRLKDRGDAFRAQEILRPLRAAAHCPPSGLTLADELDAGLAALRRILPRSCEPTANIGHLAIRSVVTLFKRRFNGIAPKARLGRVVFVTGTLGAGGAERQMARVAERLGRAHITGEPIEGIAIGESPHVVVRSLANEDRSDFFLSDLMKADVITRQIDQVTPAHVSDLNIDDKDLCALLPLLPSSVAYGVQRLVPVFRESQAETAYIWQDGAVLLAAIAALIAGVPRIVLGIRGQPPNIRVHRAHPDYEEIYQCLAEVPGVRFVTNSRATAVAYAEWLGLQPRRFLTVYNGVETLPAEPQGEDASRWDLFQKTTSDAKHTIGGVFRFDLDKRPLRWIEFAKAYLEREPRTRFVLVGAGRQLEAAQALAAKLGISQRVLFVGSSPSVGYWLSKLDAFVLLSRFEGLPNVLIEAQLAGVPVVSTPAGGATETFQEGLSGLRLSSAEELDVAELCAKVSEVSGWCRGQHDRAAAIRQFASDRFSVRLMMAQTTRLLLGWHVDQSEVEHLEDRYRVSLMAAE